MVSHVHAKEDIPCVFTKFSNNLINIFKVRDRVRVSIFKDLCDNNAHHKLGDNIGNKFDGGACAYNNNQRLPVSVHLVGLSS